uniref:hypothetical protein n=1 Tax=Psychrobacter sp. TB20-MNA-CIBAN-0197 TaxID=3140453 RepID=UPI0033306623
NKNYLAGAAHASTINSAFENTVTNELINLGFEFCKGGLQSELVFTKQSSIHLHWLMYEVFPGFKQRGWQVSVSKVTSPNPQCEVSLHVH